MRCLCGLKPVTKGQTYPWTMTSHKTDKVFKIPQMPQDCQKSITNLKWVVKRKKEYNEEKYKTHQRSPEVLKKNSNLVLVHDCQAIPSIP